MLSKIVLNFFHKIINSEEKLGNIISSYSYSERFIIAIDFQVMHKILTAGISSKKDEKLVESGQNVALALHFLKEVIDTIAPLEKIVCSYGGAQRLQIAEVLMHIQDQLLQEVMAFLEERISYSDEH